MGKKNKKKNNSNKRNSRKEHDNEEIKSKPKKSQEEQYTNGFALTLMNNKHTGDYRNISINEFSISTIKKQLFNNANLVLAYGKRYVRTKW